MLAVGSQIRVGFNVDDTSYGDANAARDAIIGCLYQSGAFESLTVTITPGWLNDYLLVSGVTAEAFGQPEDIGGFIQQVIQGCLQNITIKSRDPVVIDAIPQSQANNSAVAQPNANLYAGNPNPAKCDWKTSKSIGDFLSCEFGVSTTTAVTIGIVLTLGTLFALRR